MAKAKTEEFVAIGRRKTAIARVRISNGTGKWSINGKDVEKSKLSDAINTLIVSPLRAIAGEDSIDIRAYVSGGGEMGQYQALVLGLARSLEKMNSEWRPALKKGGFLSRDPRSKERKKPGRPGARKRFQFSKR